MDLKQQSAATYYNTHRKRSFFYSRIIVAASMVLLVIALTINIFTFYTQDNSTTQSHASAQQNIQKLLPSLPAGCEYKQTSQNLSVVCPTTVPTRKVTVPINITLPKLPQQCQFATSPSGDEIHCAPPYTPIPTVPVQLPPNCTPSNNTDALTCTDSFNGNFSFNLPTLPKGCNYQRQENNYFVVCQAN